MAECSRERLLARASLRQWPDGALLICDEDLKGVRVSLVELVAVGSHQAGDQRLTQPEAGFYHQPMAVAADRVGGEQEAGDLRQDHTLNHHRE